MKRINWFIIIILVAASSLLPQLSFSQIRAVNFEQLDSLQNIEKRPVVVFLHTSWCKYCGTMKNTTFKNKEIVKQLNDNFYFISLDIEERRDITFRGYTFKYKPTGEGTGLHQLAEQLGTINGELAYPSICFLNSAYEIVYQREGYMPAKELVNILKSLH